MALGAATEAEYIQACAWVRGKHQQTRERFGALLPAADVECVQVLANKDYQSLEQVLADIVLSSGEQTRSFQLSQPPARGFSPGKAVSLPVLFMYGSNSTSGSPPDTRRTERKSSSCARTPSPLRI